MKKENQVMKKIFTRILSVALICITLTQTALAASNDNRMVLENLFYRIDSMVNFDMPKGKEYQGKVLTEAQAALLEKNSCDLIVEAVVKNNVSIRPIFAAGDRNIAYVVWEVIALNKRELNYGRYSFDNMDRSYQMRQWEAENLDAFSTVTVGDNPPGSHTFGSMVYTLLDEDPNDNKIWLMTTVDETYSNIKLTGQTLNFHLANFSADIDDEGGNYIVVAKGPWDFSFLLDYEDSTKEHIENVTVLKRSGSSNGEKMNLKSIELSPLSLLITGNKREADRDHFTVTLNKNDGSTKNIEILVGYTTGYSGQAGSSAVNRNFYAKYLFEEPLDVDGIVSVTIGGTELTLE